MRRASVGVGALLVLMWSGVALGGNAVPKLSIRPEAWRFGTVGAGQRLQRVFVVRNTGTAVLTFESVSTTCACAVATLSTERLTPGAAGQIRLTLSTDGKSGPFNGFLIVASNDSEEPIKFIEVTGTVLPATGEKP